MDSMPPLEIVYQAVYALYNDPNSCQKGKADLWLKELQKSIFAWKISDVMLQDKKNLESCYFAAQTMKRKIQRCFQELPAESHLSLRDSLMNHISQVNKNTNAAIVVQLCVAMADLILQMTSWQEPIKDLLQKFNNTPEHLWPLLEILTVLPEEINSRHLKLNSNRREQVLKQFTCYGDLVLQHLIECLKSNQEVQTYNKILLCCTTWINIQGISITSPQLSIIISLSFEILQNYMTESELHETAADCVSVILQVLEVECYSTRDNNTKESIVPLQRLQLDLFSRIVNLEQAYYESVAHNKTAISINYCRIFSELAETFLETIINGSFNGKQHYAVKALDLALICVGHDDYKISEMTFNVWYRLSEIIYKSYNDKLQLTFKPYIEKLIVTLHKKCQMKADNKGSFVEDNECIKFRSNAFNLIKDVTFIVGNKYCFTQMFNFLTNGSKGILTWKETEAALFIMEAVAQNILPEEDDNIIPDVITAILNFPDNTCLAVKQTGALLLGELCEWIVRHPQSLESILNFLLRCLNQKGLQVAASEALYNICAICSSHLKPYFQELLKVAKALDSFDFNSEAAIYIVRGVTKVLCRLPNKDIVKYMKELCWLQAKPLSDLLKYKVVEKKCFETNPLIWLERLAVIFSATNVTLENDVFHPCKEAIEEIWPILSNILTFYQDNTKIMQTCCRCVRFIVRCLQKHSAFILEPLVKQIVELYSVHKCSFFLYLGSIIVEEFGNDENYVPGLLKMLEAFLGPTFTLFQETDGFKNHPETVDDFFILCAKFLKTSPVHFLRNGMINNIFDCALSACSLDHKEANASIMKFFLKLISCGRYDESNFTIRRHLLENILREKGQVLVTRLIHAALFNLSYYALSDVAQTIFELNLVCKEQMYIWLQETISQMSTKNADEIKMVKPEQLIEFQSSILSADNPKTLAHVLRTFIYLYR